MQSTIKAIFTGNVQGVGFRYTTVQYAANLQVAGTVQNLPDGAVELIAQGEQEKVTQLVDLLNKYFDKYIQNTAILTLSEHKAYPDFRIIFS